MTKAKIKEAKAEAQRFIGRAIREIEIDTVARRGVMIVFKLAGWLILTYTAAVLTNDFWKAVFAAWDGNACLGVLLMLAGAWFVFKEERGW